MTDSSLDLKSSLRRKRRRIWNEIAAEVHDFQNALELCEKWSSGADSLLVEAFEKHLAPFPVALFALGKLGSRELNLSSDVDLILVAKERTDELLQAFRKFTTSLSEQTPEGFVFRVDYDLRPGGRNSSNLPTLQEYIDYYSSYGETWERIALLRARPLCGNQEIINEILLFNEKFIFRKHLDYRIFDDLKILRKKIQHQPLSLQDGDIHLKLTPGGIRDIELFGQSWMVIHGGRSPELRENQTFKIYSKLANKGLLPPEQCQFLISLYRDLRALENYVQSIDDQQTHILTNALTKSGPTWVKTLSQELELRLKKSAELVKDLLGHQDDSIMPEDLQQQAISELSSEGWKELLDVKTFGHSAEQQEFLKKELLLTFLKEVHAVGGNTQFASRQLKDFLRAIRAKPSFFHLLLKEKSIFQQLVWLFGFSPYLSQIMISRPELLDSFIYRSQNVRTEDWHDLLEDLVEKKLLSEVTNGYQFLQSNDLLVLQENCTRVADEICSSILLKLNNEFQTELRIIKLGKWGGREVGLGSDLDLTFFIENEFVNENHLKVARRFLSRLSESHRGGFLYPTDLRLRPSGQAGPLVTTWSELKSFLKTSSAPWQRQAYLRSTLLGPTQPNENLRSLCLELPLSNDDFVEMGRIQTELYKNAKSSTDLKYLPGGLLDIELFSQALALKKQYSPKASSSFTTELLKELSCPELASIYQELRRAEQKALLLGESYTLSSAALCKKLLSEALVLLKELDPRPRSS